MKNLYIGELVKEPQVPSLVAVISAKSNMPLPILNFYMKAT